MKKTLGVAITCSIAACLLAFAAMAQTAPPKPASAPPAGGATPAQPAGPERIEGTIVNQGGPLSSFFQVGFFAVSIDKYSTDEELKTLLTVLKNEGQQAVLKRLWKMEQIGYFKVGGSLGYPIFFARSIAVPGGRVVRVLTNRPMVPAGYSARSGDYPFGLAEIWLPDGEKGYGTLVPMGMVSFTPQGTVGVESYGTMPLRLTDVSLDIKKKK